MLWLWAVLLLVILIVCWSLNIIGLPGNWINVAAVAIYAWLMPLEHRADIGWIVVGILIFLALLGEGIELVASSAGAASAGGSKRGAALSVVGAMCGGVGGFFLGAFLPIIGQVIASLILSGVGALLGAMLGETWKGRTLEDSFWIGHAAFWGRLFGTVGKIAAGAMIIVVTVAGLLIHQF